MALVEEQPREGAHAGAGDADDVVVHTRAYLFGASGTVTSRGR